MRAFVRLRDPSGRLHELGHGDIVGRLRRAALPLADPRISEAHAMVSLREQELKLITLRGGFAVDSKPVNEVTLAPDLLIELARDLFLTVEDVVLPDHVFGVEGALPTQVLPPVASVVTRPAFSLIYGWIEGADAWLWSDGDGYSVRQGDATRTLQIGDTVDIRGHQLRIVAVPLELAGFSATRQAGGVGAPLHLVARYDSVQIEREGETTVLAGLLGRLVAELVEVGEPLEWTALGRVLWPKEPELGVIRSRLDVNLSRLRRKLKDHRIRPDLVCTDGVGKVGLHLYPGDTVEDRG